jgi:class 3 adenylate cyclase
LLIKDGIMTVKQFLKNNIALFLFFFSFVIVLAMTINANINLKKTMTLLEQSTHEFLLSAAHALSDYVTVEELDRYRTVEDIYTEDGEFTPEYRDLKERLAQFAEKYQVLYTYFWRPYGDGELQYIVDNDYSEDICTPETIFPLEEVGMELVVKGVPITTDLEEYTISWDGLISGLAPMFDKDGNLYCAAGVDVSDERIISQRDITQQRYILQVIAIVATILTTGAMFLLYRQRNKQLNVFNANLQQMVEEETKKVLSLHETFGRYLSDDIVKDLLNSPDGLSLGGKKQHITILFTDLRGFTSISEQMGEEDVVTLLNHYFGVMVDLIHKYRGTLIEFLGDGILAIFGAPVTYESHTENAVTCAIEMQIAMDEVNQWNHGNRYPTLEMGVGINSGETIVGNIGSPKSMKYNVIGSTVNLASRVETFSTGGQILLSENSYNAVKEKVHVRHVMRAAPKGVKETVRIYDIDAIGEPHFLRLKKSENPLTRLPAPAPVACCKINDKQVKTKQLIYYMLSLSPAKAVVIPRKGEESLETFENIKVINSAGDEVFAKVTNKSDKGVVLLSFTSNAEDFIKRLTQNRQKEKS